MNRNLIIIICTALVVLLLGVVFFEIREVPAAKWETTMDYDDQEPQGLYVFRQVVERYFDGIPADTTSNLETLSDDGGLYILASTTVMSYDLADSLIEHARRGNDILIISDHVPYRLNDELGAWHHTDYYYSDRVNLTIENVSDSTESNLFEFRETDQEFQYADSTYYLLLNQSRQYMGDTSYATVRISDTLAAMITVPVGSGRMHVHVLPQMFYNAAYRQEGMFDYTTAILARMRPTHIRFINEQKQDSGINAEHPLQYIMSTPSLKAAYLLLLSGVLIYMIFGGRRRQKAIPLIEKNENTSLEYIETVSQLFYQQGQHEKLVAHMREIFYHKMEQKYYLKRDHPEYRDLLCKKSKISATDIQYILDRFQNLEDDYSFKDSQLVSLHNKLEAVYNHIELKSKAPEKKLPSTIKRENTVDK